MNELLLTLHFLGLALGVGASFAMMTLGFASKNLPAEERSQFMLRASAVAKNASIGFGLLIVSGLSMLLWRGPANVMRWGGPAFHAKLTLVLVMTGFLGYFQVQLKRARLAGGGPALQTAAKIGRVLLILGISIITLAVIAFK
jgi:uncharacterized membrane protein